MHQNLSNAPMPCSELPFTKRGFLPSVSMSSNLGSCAQFMRKELCSHWPHPPIPGLRFEETQLKVEDQSMFQHPYSTCYLFTGLIFQIKLLFETLGLLLRT